MASPLRALDTARDCEAAVGARSEANPRVRGACLLLSVSSTADTAETLVTLEAFLAPRFVNCANAAAALLE